MGFTYTELVYIDHTVEIKACEGELFKAVGGKTLTFDGGSCRHKKGMSTITLTAVKEMSTSDIKKLLAIGVKGIGLLYLSRSKKGKKKRCKANLLNSKSRLHCRMLNGDNDLFPVEVIGVSEIDRHEMFEYVLEEYRYISIDYAMNDSEDIDDDWY